MIMAGPGVPAGHRVNTATSLLDLAATAMDVIGLENDARNRACPGVSLRSIANAPDDPDRTVLSEYHDGGSTTGTFMIRWDRWKYVHYVGHDPQLFDLKADPNELHNLATERPNHPETLAALKEGEKRLRSICDPDAVNAQCFADQKARIAELGGEEACLTGYQFNHTPTPNEQARAERDDLSEL